MFDSRSDMQSILRESYLFKAFAETQLQRVIDHARRTRIDQDQWLFSQGDRADRFFLVVSGRIKLFFLTPDGAEKVIEIAGSGSTFAEALIFLNRPFYPVSAAALESSELLSLDSRNFCAILRESTDTCFLLLADLSRRVHALVREIEDLSTLNASCRVASYLLRKSPREKNSFRLDLPKAVLASRLSVKPETFSRIIRQLNQQGIISVRGSLVQIHDRAALAARTTACDNEHELLEDSFYPPTEVRSI